VAFRRPRRAIGGGQITTLFVVSGSDPVHQWLRSPKSPSR
jgi:hypothetical protein